MDFYFVVDDSDGSFIQGSEMMIHQIIFENAFSSRPSLQSSQSSRIMFSTKTRKALKEVFSELINNRNIKESAIKEEYIRNMELRRMIV